jgi:hypothetical protein
VGGGDLMSGGGGVGTDRFSDLPAQSAAKDGLTAGKSDMPNLNMGVSEGGGSGASSNGEYGGSSTYVPTRYKIPGMNGAKPAASSAAGRVPASTDVAGDGGLSLFSISSRAIQTMCNSNRLKHCGRN